MSLYKRLASVFLSLVLLLSMLITAPSAYATSTNPNSTLKLSATCCYDDAFEVLSQVNTLRKAKGLSALKMDSQLLKDAMQRAIEISLKFDHTRPDGSLCFTINDDINAENIGIIYADPTATVTSWKNSSGHSANMFSSEYKSTGVGAIIHNGTRYWVQVFSTKSTTGTTTVPANTDKTFSIALGKTTFDITMSVPSKLYVTDKETVQLTGTNKEYSKTFMLNSGDFTWSSSNPDVVSVSKNNIQALSEGTATITATGSCATVTKKITVTKFGKGKSNACGDDITWEYNNKTLTLSGSGKMYDYSTKYDDNGFISTNVLWADGLDRVETVSVGENITGIGNSAFACFSKLTKISLPTTLTSIGKDAFAYCEKLKTATLPTNITTIGSNCFYNCSALTSVKLPANLKAVPDNMFNLCASLESVSVPASVESIGQFAFTNCYKLSSVTLTENLKAIDEYAFFGCESLKQITVPYSTATIGKKALSGCTSLSKVTVDNPTTIFASTDIFANCPSGLTIYGYNNSSAQKYCKSNNIKFSAKSGTKLTASATGYTATYTASPVTDDIAVTVDTTAQYDVKYSKGSSFDYSACFYSIEALGEYWRTGAAYNSRISDYLIDSGTYPITYCVYSKGCEPTFGTVDIVIDKPSTTFSFENDVLRIPWYSKGDNSTGFVNKINNLGDLSTDDLQYTCSDTSVLAIDPWGRIIAKKYGECIVTASYKGDNNHPAHTESYTVIVYPVGEVVTGNYTCEFLEDHTAVIKRYFGKDSVEIAPRNLLNCNVVKIDDGAFRSALCEEIKIPSGITHIGKNAFLSCYYLNNVKLSNTVKTIDDYAFNGCRHLLSITIPSSVTSIGEKAFGYTAPDADGNCKKIEGFVIYGFKDTAAHQYAIDNGFEFVELEAPLMDYEIGDVDRDNTLSILDATVIQRHLAQLSILDEEQLVLADYLSDGTVSILDATQIQKKIACLI